MSPKEAVESPRIHWENNVFHVEPGLVEDETKNILFSANNQLVRWQNKNVFFGGVHTVMATSEGIIVGTGDRRRDGAVANC